MSATGETDLRQPPPRAATIAPSRVPRSVKNLGFRDRAISVGLGSSLVAWGLSRRSVRGLLIAVAGGVLTRRGLRGYCPVCQALGIDTVRHNEATAVAAQQGIRVQETVIINLPSDQIYRCWRTLADLPDVMHHLHRIEEFDGTHSRWIARGVFGEEVQWDAEIVADVAGEVIAWRSLPGGDIATAGSVQFRPLPAERGTEVMVSLKYNPPGGAVAAHVARWLGAGLEQKLAQDIRRFKQWMETGEMPTTEGQPHGVRTKSARLAREPQRFAERTR